MSIKNYYEAHASETEKAAALLPKLGEAREAPLRLVDRAMPPFWQRSLGPRSQIG